MTVLLNVSSTKELTAFVESQIYVKMLTNLTVPFPVVVNFTKGGILGYCDGK